MTRKGLEGSGHPAYRTSLPYRLLVCLSARSSYKLFSHSRFELVSSARFLPAGSQLHKAVKGAQNKSGRAGQLSFFPPPENLSLAVPYEAVSGEMQYCYRPCRTCSGITRGIFSKLLVRYFRKATQGQLPHVDVLCGTLVITVDVLLPLCLLQNSITRKLELEMSGRYEYKHLWPYAITSTRGARCLFLPQSWILLGEKNRGCCAHFRSRKGSS